MEQSADQIHATTFVYGQSCYELVSRQMSWTEAEDHCERDGGYLASISDFAEQEELLRTIDSHVDDRVWIGLNDRLREEDFEWVSGDAVILLSAVRYSILLSCNVNVATCNDI